MIVALEIHFSYLFDLYEAHELFRNPEREVSMAEGDYGILFQRHCKTNYILINESTTELKYQLFTPLKMFQFQLFGMIRLHDSVWYLTEL